VKYGVGSWSEKFGNHRALVRVRAPAGAVRVHIPWRRRDAHPERKAVWVTDAQDRRIANVVAVTVGQEYGDIVFQPVRGAGLYHAYYMPYRTQGWWAFPSVQYPPPEDMADPAWKKQHRLQPENIAGGTWRDLPEAEVVELQAINEFHRFDPMEVPATPAEVAVFQEKAGDHPVLLFPEDRRHPIRMTDALPVRWVRRGLTSELKGEAEQDEFYSFQIGVYALRQALADVRVRFSDLRGPRGAVIPAAAFRCFNQGGTDWLGRVFTKRLDVPRGRIQALWCGVAVPLDAAPGVYRGPVAVQAENVPMAEMTLELTVRPTRIAAHGDHDLWRMARLRWLDSSIGLDDEPFPPYPAVTMDSAGRTAQVLGRRVTLGDNGLPARIVSTFTPSVDRTDGPPRDILAAPIRFSVLPENGAPPEWTHSAPRVLQRTAGAVTWETLSRTPDFERRCRVKLECDGYLDCRIALRALRTTTVADFALEIPMRPDAARYMVGMGRKGGLRPERWDWQWDIRRANNHVWLGGVNAGLQCKLKNVTPHWALYGLQDSGLYKDWSGDDGKGGCTVRERNGAVVVRAYTGPMTVSKGRELHFNFGLLITPVKPLDQRHWSWRYYHAHKARPVADVAKTGATVINLHQGDALNPHINYPFLTADKIAEYARAAHDAGMKVKIYYTVRELSNYTAEFWALRSLGDEVFRNGPGFKLADHFRTAKDKKDLPKTGSSWLCEHVITGYVPAWHQPLGNGHTDAALATQGLSRWHNYYLEGLDYLVRHVGIDGLYLDGIGYDREIMKRVRKVLLRANPGGLIDFHSGNNFHPKYGLNNVVGQYMELLSCIDSLWLGEGFNYDESPDYWLIEISGIPFGLFSEMLQGGGNPWRGMLYGMTGRLGWGGAPRPIWQVWDDFGIDKARMLGYWDPACPIQTDRSDVLATAYVRREPRPKVLIALASWTPVPVRCRLRIDFEALGLSPEKAHLYAPPIDNFQPGALFKPGEKIPVHPRRGWLLVLDDQPHAMPAPETADPFAGRRRLYTDTFNGTTLEPGWRVQLSTRVRTRVFLKEQALHIEANANSAAFVERSLPPGTALVVCRVRPETDRGATWGPGLALVWPDGRGLRVNLRTEGRFGVYGYGREILGGIRFPDEEYILIIKADPGKDIRVQASLDGRVWQTIATVPRKAFPGIPSLVRLGKMGIPKHEVDFRLPGPIGQCSVRDLQVLGAAE